MSTAIHVIPDPLPTTTETRLAAYLLAEYLERLGVEVVFGLTGHTVIGMLDALGRSSIRYVSTRHEQVAAHAADGYARASGKPGVLLTHLGPGLTNAATGVANAALDSIPMVVIAGDVQSYFYGRHPHQEINLHQDADQFQIYRPFCKRVYRVDNARDLLVPVRHEPDPALPERVQERDDRVSAQAEDHLDAEALEIFGEQVRGDPGLRRLLGPVGDVRRSCAHTAIPGGVKRFRCRRTRRTAPARTVDPRESAGSPMSRSCSA